MENETTKGTNDEYEATEEELVDNSSKDSATNDSKSPPQEAADDGKPPQSTDYRDANTVTASPSKDSTLTTNKIAKIGPKLATSPTPQPKVSAAAKNKYAEIEAKLAALEGLEMPPAGDDTGTEHSSSTGTGSIDDLDDSLMDEMDMSDVSSSFAENESIESKTPSPSKKPSKRRTLPMMQGYRRRRKGHVKKPENTESAMRQVVVEESPEERVSSTTVAAKLNESPSEMRSASPHETSKSTLLTQKYSGTYSEVTSADKYCWTCHNEGGQMLKCIACPRVYHVKCHANTEPIDDPNNFHCLECSAILKADNVNTRSPVMQTVNLDQLCTLLKHVINKLKLQRDAHYFMGPVDTIEFPHYREYIVYPMDISVLERNCKNEVYGCTEAFLADVKWIVHNSIVFNSKQARITNVAKNLLKICKKEIMEIETCAECYYNLLVRQESWFIEVCNKPHILIWARFKSYPPWPAKAMRCRNGEVDCRFFGAHDRAWVPLKDCYLYSDTVPLTSKMKRGSQLEAAMQEVEKHIEKLKEKYGTFVYAPARVAYVPEEELVQLKMMLPNYNSTSRSSTRPEGLSGKVTPKTLFEPSTQQSNPPSKDIPSKDTVTEKSSSECESVSNEERLPVADDSTSSESEHSAKLSEDEHEDVKAKPVEAVVPVSSKPVEIVVPAPLKPESPIPEPSKPDSETSKTPPKEPVAREEKMNSSEASCDESARSNNVSPAKGALEQTESPESKSKKTVSVKKIESINASVEQPLPVTMSVSLENMSKEKIKELIVASEKTPVIPQNTASNVVAVQKQEPKAKPRLEMTVGVGARSNTPVTILNVLRSSAMDSIRVKSDKVASAISVTKIPNPVAKSPVVAEKQTEKAVTVLPMKKEAKAASSSRKPSVAEADYSLEKVKDEPMDTDSEMSVDNNNDVIVEETMLRKTVPKPVEVSYRKRSSQDDDKQHEESKRPKAEINCRTVNITENVTLSVVNHQSIPSDVANKANSMKPKPLMAGRTPMTENSQTNDGKPIRPVVKMVKPVLPAVSVSTSTIASKTNGRLVQNVRLCNGVVNGSVPSNSGITVTPSQAPGSVSSENGSGSATDIIEECMLGCQNELRKYFETVLDKMAGKGDSRAKIILMQKKMESMQRSHELLIDEIKRDYEVQIAEFRATSISQRKFELASERMKFEQEKERAVKEAKSKQWCSNCQKIANYYCCWNTAYCDFECQKDHWTQHMHFCKNDVKKKAAESSENEPPRIMMQNDISNNYTLVNGFEKPTTTYTFPNTSTTITSKNSPITRMPVKNISSSNFKAINRPLPRVTASVTCTPSSLSSQSAMTGGSLLNPSHADRDTSSQNASTNTPMRSTMMGSISVHPYIRHVQQQFHK